MNVICTSSVNGGICIKETSGFNHSFNIIHVQCYDTLPETYRQDCRPWRQSDYDVILYEVHTNDALHIAVGSLNTRVVKIIIFSGRMGPHGGRGQFYKVYFKLWCLQKLKRFNIKFYYMQTFWPIVDFWKMFGLEPHMGFRGW